MKEKNIGSLFLILVSAAIAVFIVGIFFSVKAHIIYEKALNMKAPPIKIGKIDYYNDAVTLMSEAIKINKLNADYLVFKADLLFGALSEQLAGTMHIMEKEIEDLYIKAISLNPANFEYHLKLGWFYAQVEETKAEDEIRKAIKLYPVYYRNYLYFSKYYLKNKKEKEAFDNILLTFYYGSNVWWREIMKEIKEDLKNSTGFYFDEETRKLSFVIFMPGPELDFKKYGFSHTNIPFDIKVYIKKSEDTEVLIYKNDYLIGRLKKTLSSGDVDIYEFNIAPYTGDIYIDELKIKTIPPKGIEKIEFIKIFE